MAFSFLRSYQALRNSFEEAQREGGASKATPLPPHLNLAAAAQAGACVVLLTNPIWVLKTRLQLQAAPALGALAPLIERGPSRDYAGLVDAARRIIAEEGPRGLYRGLIPALVMVSHSAVQFTAYEELKRALTAFHRAAASKQTQGGRASKGEVVLSPQEHLAMGALSKLLASTFTYPLQTIRSRLQQRSDLIPSGGARYSGLVDAVVQTWRREGLRGFYRGVVPNVLRVMPSSAITFAVYEAMLKILPP